MITIPDPGRLPTKPEPKSGEKILFTVKGYPPYKDLRFSIRNPAHRIHDRFMALRRAGFEAMQGRKWYSGPVELNLCLFAPGFEKGRELTDYLSGVCDCLDGSHGPNFTYLPVVYQDDCQIYSGRSEFIRKDEPAYSAEIIFA